MVVLLYRKVGQTSGAFAIVLEAVGLMCLIETGIMDLGKVTDIELEFFGWVEVTPRVVVGLIRKCRVWKHYRG